MLRRALTRPCSPAAACSTAQDLARTETDVTATFKSHERWMLAQARKTEPWQPGFPYPGQQLPTPPLDVKQLKALASSQLCQCAKCKILLDFSQTVWGPLPPRAPVLVSRPAPRPAGEVQYLCARCSWPTKQRVSHVRHQEQLQQILLALCARASLPAAVPAPSPRRVLEICKEQDVDTSSSLTPCVETIPLPVADQLAQRQRWLKWLRAKGRSFGLAFDCTQLKAEDQRGATAALEDYNSVMVAWGFPTRQELGCVCCGRQHDLGDVTACSFVLTHQGSLYCSTGCAYFNSMGRTEQLLGQNVQLAHSFQTSCPGSLSKEFGALWTHLLKLQGFMFRQKLAAERAFANQVVLRS